MAIIQKFGQKQSYEEYYNTFDFFRIIASDEIDVASIIVVDPEGEDVTDDLTDISRQIIMGSRVHVFVQGGESGKTYKFTCKIETEIGERYEMDATMKVQDL